MSDTVQSPVAFASSDYSLDSALREVARVGASDLHMAAETQPLLRLNGELRPVWPQAPQMSATGLSRVLRSILNERQLAEFEQNHELDFAYQVDGVGRFRVNYYQQRGNLGGAFRLIDANVKPLESLGLPREIARFARYPRGLVLLTGPTGSGKSTTLASLVDIVNRERACHIMTIEDPIEYLHHSKKALVNQREVGEDTYGFAEALKHVLRQDPDVILIGELRDLETIQIALTAAETGHLVFSTLHTQDAAQTIDRVIDVFPAHQQSQVRTQLAAALRGVVVQALLPTKGHTSRTISTEVMFTTKAIANMIREGKGHQIYSALQAGRELGMHTMDQSLAQLVNSGTVDYDDARELAHDDSAFNELVDAMLRRDEVKVDPAFDSIASASHGYDSTPYGAKFGRM